jgi:hypothetical protein
VIPLALVAADAVSTAVGLHVGAVEANPVAASMSPALMVAIGVLASLVMVRLLAVGGWLGGVAMVWLAVKGAVVAWNMATLL